MPSVCSEVHIQAAAAAAHSLCRPTPSKLPLSVTPPQMEMDTQAAADTQS